MPAPLLSWSQPLPESAFAAATLQLPADASPAGPKLAALEEEVDEAKQRLDREEPTVDDKVTKKQEVASSRSLETEVDLDLLEC